MTIREMQAAAEAILFASGEPLEVERLSQVLGIDDADTEQILENLKAELEERGSGLCLLRMDHSYQICSRREYADKIREVLDLKRNTPLSSAAFEVLAVVAYNQPVTKSYVEQIRGVDCTGVISTLCQRGLLEEKGRLELPGRPLLYGTTPLFLKCFCVSTLDELPELPEREAPAAQETTDDAEQAPTEPDGTDGTDVTDETDMTDETEMPEELPEELPEDTAEDVTEE